MNIAGLDVGWNEVAVILVGVLLIYTAYVHYYLMHLDDRLSALEKLLGVE